MKNLISTKDMPLEEWLKWRKKGIGGSDAAAVCGLNKWVSSIDVWIDKTKPDKIDLTDSEAMRVGRDLEEYVSQRFTEATGKKVHRVNMLMQHDDYEFMLANVDRKISGENAYLECKTANAYKAKDWEDGKVPESYEIQCHHYMAVTGADAVYIACLIMGIEFVVVKIERNEELIRDLIKIESDFWKNNVLKKIMPPPDGSESAGNIIKELYTNDDITDEIIDISDDTEKLDRIDELTELIDSLKQECDQLKQEIQLHMAEHEEAYANGRKVTWRLQAGKSGLDTKSLKNELPDVYSKYLKQGEPYRVLRIAKKKQEDE